MNIILNIQWTVFSLAKHCLLFISLRVLIFFIWLQALLFFTFKSLLTVSYLCFYSAVSHFVSLGRATCTIFLKGSLFLVMCKFLTLPLLGIISKICQINGNICQINSKVCHIRCQHWFYEIMYKLTYSKKFIWENKTQHRISHIQT